MEGRGGRKDEWIDEKKEGKGMKDGRKHGRPTRKRWKEEMEGRMNGWMDRRKEGISRMEGKGMKKGRKDGKPMRKRWKEGGR